MQVNRKSSPATASMAFSARIQESRPTENVLLAPGGMAAGVLTLTSAPKQVKVGNQSC
jgi:hypothetical protein